MKIFWRVFDVVSFYVWSQKQQLVLVFHIIYTLAQTLDTLNQVLDLKLILLMSLETIFDTFHRSKRSTDDTSTKN